MFDIDEDSLIVAVALYAQYALDYLNGNCSGGRS